MAYLSVLAGYIGGLASLAAFTSMAPLLAFIPPVPLAVWQSCRIAVVLHDGSGVIIRNPFRTHRMPTVVFAVVMPTGPYGARQVNFVDAAGRSIAAFATTLWSQREEPTEHRARYLAEWVERCRRNGVPVSTSEAEMRRAMRRTNRITWGLDVGSADPAESLRAVRRAAVDDTLISIRPTDDGFRVVVETLDEHAPIASSTYSTLEAATAAGLEEIERRAAQRG